MFVFDGACGEAIEADDRFARAGDEGARGAAFVFERVFLGGQSLRGILPQSKSAMICSPVMAAGGVSSARGIGS